MTTVVVLGMHRSGTSCVTRALHDGGMFLGNDLLNATATDNVQGHWEAWEAIRINEEILEASGAAWHNAPLDLLLTAPPGIEARIAAFLKQLAVEEISGFKDPRTLITFPIWQPYLQDFEIVACLRHPMNVARSLVRRHMSWTMEQGLQLWAQYNARLLEYTRQLDQERVHWFDFDLEADAVAAALNGLIQRLGLHPQASGFNPLLRHHEEHLPIEDSRVAELYQSLRQRAVEQSRISPAAAGAPRVSETQSIQHGLRQLGDAHSRHDELIQRQQATLWELERRMREMRSCCESIPLWTSEQAALVSRCEAAELRIDALERALRERDADSSKMWLAHFAEMAESTQRLSEQLEWQDSAHTAMCRQLQDKIGHLERQLFWPKLVRTVKRAGRHFRRGWFGHSNPAKAA